MNTRKCSNDPDSFCYICGRLTFTKKRMKIDDDVKQLYCNYFNISISNQDKSWVSHTTCKSCVGSSRRWNNAKSDVPGIPFKIPVIWREAASHGECQESRLQERNLLSPGTTFSWYRHREESLIKYFSEGDNYVFCNDVSNFMQKLRVLYDASLWRLFIDFSDKLERCFIA